MKHKPEKNISPGFERAVTLKLLLITGHMKAARHSHENWVEGDRFWDREKDIELMIKKRDDGAHILLVAQRRMGKTS